jgi:hypothetical protein
MQPVSADIDQLPGWRKLASVRLGRDRLVDEAHTNQRWQEEQ